MKTTYFINLDDRSRDLEIANIMYHSIDGNCTIKNYDSVPMMKSIMNALRDRYEAKRRAIMSRIIASYLGNLVNKGGFDYNFNFNDGVLHKK